jgi:site-specific recombinase XerD
MTDLIHGSRQGVSLVPEKYRATLRRLLEASTAGATRRAYRGQLRRFTEWCRDNSLCPLPAAPETVAAFISFLAESGKGNATVNQALAAISVAHRVASLPTPTSDIAVQKAARGFRREFGTAPHKKPAATADIVKKMLLALEAGETIRDARDAALLAVGFAGGFRRSELVALNVEDLSWEIEDGCECCVISIRKSKTDQECHGMEKAVFAEAVPRFSPVSLLRHWLEQGAFSDGPVFRRIRRGGHVQKMRVSDQVVTNTVRRAAKLAGLAVNFSAHSLRSGFVTTCVRQGKTP